MNEQEGRGGGWVGGEPERGGLVVVRDTTGYTGSSQEPGSFPLFPVADFKDKERGGRDENGIARKGCGGRKPGRKT